MEETLLLGQQLSDMPSKRPSLCISAFPLRFLSWALAAFPGIGVNPVMALQSQVEALRVDHIIVGIADLDRGVAELRQATGVTAQPGGVHPGRGTKNALISLGSGTYLELVAPSGEPDSSGMAAYLASLPHLSPGGWALSAPDLGATIHRLESAGFSITGPIPGSRRQPDGGVLHWTTAHLVGDQTGLAPFLIQWEPGSTHPSATSPAGCQLTSVRLAAAAPERLRQLLALMGAPATVDSAPTSSMEFTLACPAGRVLLGQ